MEKSNTAVSVRIRNLVWYYLRLGTLGFGGPVALCGQMEKELVQERRWLSKEEMRDGIAVCQSLPGPLAIQVGIFISYLRGGFWGAWAGGWAFILPNFIIVSALGALYVHFSGLPILTSIIYGVSPAVIALILHSCYRLAKLGMEDALQWLIAAICFVVTVAVHAEVAPLFIASGVVGILYYGSLFRRKASSPSLTAAVTAGAGIGKLAGFCHSRQTYALLPEGRLAHFRKRPCDRAISGSGVQIRLSPPSGRDLRAPLENPAKFARVRGFPQS